MTAAGRLPGYDGAAHGRREAQSRAPSAPRHRGTAAPRRPVRDFRAMADGRVLRKHVRPMDDWWACPSCHSLNPSSQGHCYGCLRERPGAGEPADDDMPATEDGPAQDLITTAVPRPVAGGRRRRPRGRVLTAAAVVLAAGLLALAAATAAGAFGDPQRDLVEATNRMCTALRAAVEARADAAGTTGPIVLGRVAERNAEAVRAGEHWASALDRVPLSGDLAVRAAVYRSHLRDIVRDPRSLQGPCDALAMDMRAAVAR